MRPEEKVLKVNIKSLSNEEDVIRKIIVTERTKMTRGINLII